MDLLSLTASSRLHLEQMINLVNKYFSEVRA